MCVYVQRYGFTLYIETLESNHVAQWFCKSVLQLQCGNNDRLKQALHYVHLNTKPGWRALVILAVYLHYLSLLNTFSLFMHFKKKPEKLIMSFL